MSVTSGWGRLTWGQANWNLSAVTLKTGWGAKSWGEGEWGELKMPLLNHLVYQFQLVLDL